ncbi:MAG: DUF2190 family protein [Eubacteriales bacterium]
MAKNMSLPKALHIELPVPSGVKSGDPVAVGAFRGVAQTDRDENGNATVWLDGSTVQTVTGAVASVGLPVYIKTADRTLSTTATDSVLFGYALGTKAAAAGPLEIALLNGAAQV